MNQQRRVFRGRGGPTDRRLPKHNARRRRATTNKNAGAQGVSDNFAVAQSVPQIESDGGGSVNSTEDNDISQVEDSSDVVVQEAEALGTDSTRADATESDPENERTVKFQKEVNHLLKRIRNNKTSIQTSTLALNKPSTYQTNVLRAVQNCVTEWKSILHHFPDQLIDTTNSVTTDKNISLCRASGLALFELVQLALQCGPLAGSKPGYFKRCGSDVANLVLEFLTATAVDRQDAMAMYWSDKQAGAVEKWKDNARKAVQSDNPASKSVQKRHQKAINCRR